MTEAQPQERDIDGAIESLQTNQRQLDQDGIYVGVSRQALEEVLAWIALDLPRLRASQAKLGEALRQFADCDLNEGNCASLEVATRRIRSVALAALDEKHAKEDGHEPE